MAYRGDLLQTEALLVDGSGDPITGRTITIIASTGPGGSDLDPARFSWAEEEDGVYLVTYQTTEGDLYGRYYVAFQFDDPDASVFETEDGEWFLTSDRPTPEIYVPPLAVAAGYTNVPPSHIDDDGTWDQRYWRRSEQPTPADHTHAGTGGVQNFNNSGSITFTVDGQDITAAVVFGTTAGTVAEGDDLAAKANTADLATVATSGDYTDLLNIPSSFTPSSHNHGAANINAGVFDIARIPTGTDGSSVALGNHVHADETSIEIMLDGNGSAIPATTVWTWFKMPWTGTINQRWLTSFDTGSIKIDLWKGTYGQWPLNSSHVISGASGITLGGTNKSQSTIFTGWSTTTFTKDEFVVVYVDTVSGITKANLALDFDRTI